MAVQIKYGGSTIATVTGTSTVTKRLLTQEKICRNNIEVAVTPPTTETRNVTPSGSQQVITPGTGYDYLSSVTVAAVQAESRTVTPSGSQQVITPGTGYNYLSRVTVSAIPTETKSAELSMAYGNQTVSATSGKYMTAVTINKPSTLLAANIKKGVNIGGVTGTYEGSGGGGGGDDEYSISPSTQTWQHNTYVSIGLDIAADGSLTVYKSSGSGTANNLVICYPQSDTYSAASEITSIPTPQAEGTYTMDITVWWDNQSGAHNDHNNHTISYSILFESVRLIISYDPIFGEVCFFERLRIFDKFFLSVPKTKLAPQPKLKRLMFDPDIQFSLLTISLFTAYCSVDYSHGIP